MKLDCSSPLWSPSRCSSRRCSQPRPRPRRPSPARPPSLVVWAGEEPGGGAAGSVFYRVELTNLSGKHLHRLRLSHRERGEPEGQADRRRRDPRAGQEGQDGEARPGQTRGRDPPDRRGAELPDEQMQADLGRRPADRHPGGRARSRPAGLPGLRLDRLPSPLGRRDRHRHRERATPRPPTRGGGQALASC